jgi:heptosyltransferase-2
MSRAEKILVRGVNWLGDAVMSTPALQRLREAKPGAHVTLLTHEKLAELWREHPALDAVLTFAEGESVWSVGRRLRAERFDLALIFPNSPRTALEAFLARIPERIGYARNARGLLLTRTVPERPGSLRMKKRSRADIDRRIAAKLPRETYPAGAHHVHEYLHLVAVMGGDPSPVPPMLRVKAEEIGAFKERFGIRDRGPLFGLNAGAEYGPAKRWPVERFAEAATRIHTKTNCHWILFGGKGDPVVTDAVEQLLSNSLGNGSVTNVAGKTSLRELCAGLAACSLLLTNDTGPMHVAAALGTPVIVPFGSTSPELTGPLGATVGVIMGDVSCAPCFLRECPIDFRCMKAISVEQVVQSALRLTFRREK